MDVPRSTTAVIESRLLNGPATAPVRRSDSDSKEYIATEILRLPVALLWGEEQAH